jgi:hypothetical protein
MIHFGVDRLGPLWTRSFIENAPLSGKLMRCQSDHGNYACSHGGVDMSSSGWTSSHTRVPVARHMWLRVVLFGIKWSCHLRTSALWVTCSVLETAKHGYQGPGQMLS